MPHPRLVILNAPDASWWDTRRDLPRFLEPRDFSLNPCTSCVGHCCQPAGAITITEALRISAILEMPLDDVVERRTADPQRVATRREPDAIPVEDGGDQQLFMRLKNGWCPFLHHVGNRGLCSIYALRPAICRVYPFELSWKGTHLRVGSTTYCPTPWLQDDATRARLAETMEAWDQDVALHRSTVRAWKRRKTGEKSWKAFAEFALRRLQEHLGVDAERLLRPPRRGLKAVNPG